MSYRPFAVTVVAATTMSASFRRLRLAGGELAELEWAGVDQRVKLVLAGADLQEALTTEPGDGWYATWCALPEGVRPPMRTYTIAAHRPDQCEVDIDVAVHGEAGPLSRFALGARPGDRLLLVAPGRGGAAAGGVAWRPGGARHVLCVGDETALPAIRNIVATLDAGQACRVVLEVPHDDDRLPLPSPARVRVDWAVRSPGAPVGTAADRVLFGGPGSPASPGEPDPDLWQEASGDDHDRYAWVAGEVGWVNRLRKRLAAAGYDGRNAAFMGYWRAGHPSRG